MAPKKSTQKKANFYLDVERHARLKEISKRSMIPMSALFRKAIDQIIREYSK